MEITGISSISVHNKKFYAGQTKEEAKQRGIYERTWSRDFINIDTNEDGVLSVKEIIKERKRSNKKDISDLATVAGLLFIIDTQTIGLTGALKWLAVAALCALFNINHAHNTKKMEKYIIENKIDKNKPNNLNTNA